MTMQSSDFKWFVDHMPELFEEYGHSFLLIRDQRVYGHYKSYADGVRAGLKMFEPGDFIVQECGDSESVYTNYIASTNFTLA